MNQTVAALALGILVIATASQSQTDLPSAGHYVIKTWEVISGPFALQRP